NKKPSFSGYGIFEEPDSKEFNQAEYCKSHGYWQYGFTKYVSFGKINKSITFSEEANRVLILKICEQKEVGKVFIEPHLKVRMSLNNEKIRFHGCQAVRHDDHIHFQLK